MVRMTYCMIQWKLKPCRIFQRKTNNKYWWSFEYRSNDLEASSYKDKNNKIASRRSKIIQETLNWKVLKTWFKCGKPTGYYKRCVFLSFFSTRSDLPYRNKYQQGYQIYFGEIWRALLLLPFCIWNRFYWYVISSSNMKFES